jgi:hypothetical protein
MVIRRFELTRFPTRSPLPFAALPSILLIPSARFTDWHRLVRRFACPVFAYSAFPALEKVRKLLEREPNRIGPEER